MARKVCAYELAWGSDLLIVPSFRGACKMANSPCDRPISVLCFSLVIRFITYNEGHPPMALASFTRAEAYKNKSLAPARGDPAMGAFFSEIALGLHDTHFLCAFDMHVVDLRQKEDPGDAPLVGESLWVEAEKSCDKTAPEEKEGTNVGSDVKAPPPEIAAKRVWVRDIRLKFCRRPEFPITSGIIDNDGYLNQE